MNNLGKLRCPALIASSKRSGWVGVKPFTTAARPDETIALAIERQHDLKRENAAVLITPATGPVVIYAPLDTRVRSIVTLSPDTVSKAVVTQRTVNLPSTEFPIERLITREAPDWGQTFMLLDLPVGINTGAATISIAESSGTVIQPASVEILPGERNRNSLGITYVGSSFSLGSTLRLVLQASKDLERFDQHVVDFVGETFRHALKMERGRTRALCGQPSWRLEKSDRERRRAEPRSGRDAKYKITIAPIKDFSSMLPAA